jgi:uncharacterized phage-associated protein
MGVPMPDIISPKSLADFLLASCRERGEVLTNLKLQKLLYYSQAWFLALHDKALFAEDFQAWVHGPVLPSQYHRFKDYQWKPLLEDVTLPVAPSKVVTFLEEIVDVFGAETAVTLELMTHRERPWIKARGNLPADAVSTNVITKKSMHSYYKELGNEGRKGHKKRRAA